MADRRSHARLCAPPSTRALCGVAGVQLTQTAAGRWHSPLVMLTVMGSAVVLGAHVQTPGLSHFLVTPDTDEAGTGRKRAPRYDRHWSRPADAPRGG
ncbi:hypothetical protein HEP85_40645 [Streptomyces sp. RPA4-2]|uniref:hypothetical protein n=1 Tax=Streptomyces sp. RPA4-2 TaxID=2721244 RepID=UPI00143ED945|nr:hypothetical protein HEP85_40645 [Streptomyces sp. RPA4-2]